MFFINISVDMVRLECLVEDGMFNYFIASYLEKSPWLTSYPLKLGFKDYRHNFKVECSNGSSFWMGYKHNSERLSLGSHKLVIEFNPNKVLDDVNFQTVFCKIVLFSKHDFIVKGVDVAVDVEHDISNLVFDKTRYRKYRHFVEESETYYFGNRGWGGVKVYDKKAELKSKGVVIDSPCLTRIEYTIKINTSIEYIKEMLSPGVINFPSLSLSFLDVSLLDGLGVVDRCCLMCLINGDVTLSDFKRTKKNTLKELIGSLGVFTVDDSIKKNVCECIVSFLCDFCNKYGIKYIPF